MPIGNQCGNMKSLSKLGVVLPVSQPPLSLDCLCVLAHVITVIVLFLFAPTGWWATEGRTCSYSHLPPCSVVWIKMSWSGSLTIEETIENTEKQIKEGSKSSNMEKLYLLLKLSGKSLCSSWYSEWHSKIRKKRGKGIRKKLTFTASLLCAGQSCRHFTVHHPL